jgi:hypothetical protein
MDIQQGMPVICADGQQHGTVDRVEGQYIKLTRDEQGQHHWLPLSSVDHVDEHVHLNLRHGQVHGQLLDADPNAEVR